jgi:predicted nucleotide-binding protein (sugar kinase/HSP70/actin superfamily)
LRGGEGHLEVAKFLDTVHRRSAQMVISVKPFSCMPSSGISDGVLSLVKAKHPEVIFTTIETTGDAAVNAYSRIQMDLFKAHRMVSSAG